MPTENAWSLNSDNILVIEGKTPDVLSYDYENKNISAWYLNTDNKIVNGLMGEPISWSPPYPVGKWYLDDNNILMANGIPERLSLSNIFTGDVNVTNIKLGDISVKSVFIGDTQVF